MDVNHDHVKLTASEISYLWTTYLADTMAVCVFLHFLQQIEDEDIKTLIQHGLDLSQQHVEIIRDIFKKEKIQVPHGFTEKDVNRDSKRLFSDVFYLYYIQNMAKGGLATNSRALPHVFRPDIHSFYRKCLTSSIELETEASRLVLEKGLAQRTPVIPYPQTVEFVHKQSFILEGLGRRPRLTGTEVTNLYTNILSNYLGAGLATGFSQVAQSKKVRNYFLRGKEISQKHINVFSNYLRNYALSIPSSIEPEVTDSTEPPFSDKLMMFHFSLMIYTGIGNYGISIAETQRSDLVMDYSRFQIEVLKYSEDGANIMIGNEWLEQPPLTADRNELAKG